MVPVYATGQVHVYLFGALLHEAPFLHGDDAQLLITKHTINTERLIEVYYRL